MTPYLNIVKEYYENLKMQSHFHFGRHLNNQKERPTFLEAVSLITFNILPPEWLALINYLDTEITFIGRQHNTGNHCTTMELTSLLTDINRYKR